MKIQKVSRDIKFDLTGMYFGEDPEKNQVIRYANINRGPSDEPCPIWYLNVEKQLATKNATSNPKCCLKIVQNSFIKTICIDQEVYEDKCE